MVIDLVVHPEWREKCKKEIRDLLSNHIGETRPGTLHEKFGAIPISAWESELPILDACIRESQRILMSGMVAIRRNHNEGIKFGDKVIKQGDFLLYFADEVHMNPEYYPEPHKYDPGRWLRPDPVPKAIYPFLGWGAGRHPCSGMKVAKLEMKSILVLCLTKFKFDLVDIDGKFPDPLPVPNRNDLRVRVELRLKCTT